MIQGPDRRLGTWRHVCLTLAMLAVTLKVLVPAGFMLAAPSPGLPFPIVLCTAQGAAPVDAGTLPGGHAPSDKAPDGDGHDSPCAFAGHGLAAAPPSPAYVAAPYFPRAYAPPAVPAVGLAPGRGLTGPPLPARGPPSLLI